jgi:hypothetical protein
MVRTAFWFLRTRLKHLVLRLKGQPVPVLTVEMCPVCYYQYDPQDYLTYEPIIVKDQIRAIRFGYCCPCCGSPYHTTRRDFEHLVTKEQLEFFIRIQ